MAELPDLIASGVPTAKAFMVFDFRLTDDRLLAALQAMGRHGGMLRVHCENATIIDALTAEALAGGNVAPSSRADPADLCRGGGHAGHRSRPRRGRIGLHRPPLVRRCPGRGGDRQGRGWPVYAETCPHYLSLTEDRYAPPDEGEVIKSVISPPLRSDSDRQAMWLGLSRGGLDLVGSDHVPDRLAVEKRVPAPPFPQISNGAPGIETMMSVVYAEGVAVGRITVERMVDVLATKPARLFGLPTKGAIEVGRDADLVLFDPAADRTIRRADFHHTSDFTPYEGRSVPGSIRTALSAAGGSSGPASSSAPRGHGQLVPL